MDKKHKIDFMSRYMQIIQLFLTGAIWITILFTVVTQFVLPSEREASVKDCQFLDVGWNLVEDGKRYPVEAFPGKVEAEYGEVVTLETTLPDSIYGEQFLCLRSVWQDVYIFIDGQLRQSYNTKATRPFGVNSASRYIFVELRESDSGKILSYSFSSNSKYAGQTFVGYIGNKAGIWAYLVRKSGMRTLASGVLLLMSAFCLIICYVLKLVYKKKLILSYLAWAIFLGASWMMSELEFRQVILKNVSATTAYAYWSLMLIPIALTIYINDIQKGYYQKYYNVTISYSVIVFVVGTILQLFDIVQFVQFLPFIHIGLIITILCIILSISIDTIQKRIKSYVFVGIGIYGMLVTAIIELIFYYVGNSTSLGAFLVLGLIFLLVMAILNTGQDLLYTEKKRQQALAAKEAQAKFLANMSHEIRTPINAVIGMNEMILRESNDVVIQGYAHNIQSASNMLLGLVNDILDFSKIESGQLELVEDTYSVDKVIMDELILLKTKIDKKPIEIKVELDENMPSKLYGDELRIKQIFTNLLSNAVKYTKEGTIMLRGDFNWIDDEKIEMIFSIADTGMGIKEEDLSKLFTSFKRLEINKNRAIEGTGLGLNITKQLVELMYGRINVESEYGKGSTFTIVIPQKVVDKQAVGKFEESSRQRTEESINTNGLFTAPDATVLVVDDNEMNLELMKELLKRTMINVDLVGSGKKCLEYTKNKKYDIIFMDHMMPDMDGIETLHILRSDKNNINHSSIVIVLTANVNAGIREKYQEEGFDDYFSKPIQVNELDKLLMNYLPKNLVNKKVSEGDVEKNTKKDCIKNEDDLLFIDFNVALLNCSNSDEIYKKSKLSFCNSAREYVTKIFDFAENCEWDEYAITMQNLKNSALNIGAVNFAELSKKHEQAANEKNIHFILSQYEEYIMMLKKLIIKTESEQ